MKIANKEFHIYHINSTDLENITYIINSHYEYNQEYGEQATFFNRNILVDKFPSNKDNNASEIKRRLEEVEQQDTMCKSPYTSQ